MKTALSIYLFGYVIIELLIIKNLIQEVFLKSKLNKKLSKVIRLDFFLLSFLSLFYPIFILVALCVFVDFYSFDKFNTSVLNYKSYNTNNSLSKIETDINKELEELKILSERKQIQDLDFFYDTEFIQPPPKTNPADILQEYNLFTPKPVQK